ncbi:MAG: hypothetical protein PHX43_06170 [Alphaproteobacteria bacterium]|nr:hypothetical protein [Alphaproteobacteria bacterium]
MTSAPKPPADPVRSQQVAPSSVAKATALLTATLDVMEDLTKLLSLELKVLEKQDMKELGEILPKKHRLITSYQANLKSLDNNPELVKLAPEELRAKAKAVAIKMRDVVEHNANAMRGAICATRRVIHNVMSMIREEASPSFMSYGNSRNPQSVAAPYSPTCQPLAVKCTA